MRRRRGGRPDRILADGPGKLCQAFGLDRGDDGTDLVDDPDVDHRRRRHPAAVGARSSRRAIGIRVATDVPWRWLAPTT